MCTNPISMRIPATFSERLRGYVSDSVVTIPCGKCAECMKKKQNSIQIRCYNEAVKRGSMHFITFTYNNKALPFTRTIIEVSKDSGDVSAFGAPEVLKANEIPSFVYEAIMSDFESVAKERMRFYDIRHVLSDSSDDFEYYLRYMPSHDYRDIKALLKLARKWYKLTYKKDANFTYLVVPEFGEHSTRRPHYHCCLFGCPDVLAEFICRAWKYGLYRPSAIDRKITGLKEHWYVGCAFTSCFKEVYYPRGFADLKRVNAVNEDNSNGFAKVASYVGKYVGKGVFEDFNVRCGFLELPRVAVSKHFGLLPQHLIDWHLGRDVFGNYDDETLNGLSDNVIDKIVKLVASRLVYFYPNADKSISLPAYFKRYIFKGKLTRNRLQVSTAFKKATYSFIEWPACGKMVYSALYYKVQDFIRDKFLQDAQKEFESFISYHYRMPIREAVALFESLKSRALKNREEAARERQQKNLRKSKF